LPAVIGAFALFGLATAYTTVFAAGSRVNNPGHAENLTSTGLANLTTTASTTDLIMDNGTLNCQAIADKLGGIGVPNGKVCDVVVVRQAPQITGDNGLNLNQFTLMNSVLEFYMLPPNATATTVSNTTGSLNSTGNQQVYVMGDFALLETEMNDVLTIVKDNGWTVTGIHNHMINETPKTSFMHWEATGDINQVIDNANEAFAATSIKG
jgi:uncharacterized protein DUF1259